MSKDTCTAKGLFRLLFLAAMAGGIGVWSIVHTVVITRDAVNWIERARVLGTRESTSGTAGISGQNYLFGPERRGLSGSPENSSMGLSVGTNGISVVEYSGDCVPALAVYDKEIGAGWNHIAVTYSDKQPRIYLNGQRVHAGLISPKKNVFAPRLLGGRDWGYFKGHVRAVGVWNRTLSDDEIMALSAKGAVEEGLVGYWPLDEGRGQTVHDRSGNQHHAAINGASWAMVGQEQSLYFDGIDDIVLWNYPPPANQFSVSAWVQAARRHAIPSPMTMLPQMQDPGLPLMIYAWHRLLSGIGLGQSMLSWVLAGQSLNLLCRILSIVPLYGIGRLLVGGRQAFWAMLILVVLPWPAEWGHDVLREWPHLLFLAGGLLAMLGAFAGGRILLFLPAGCMAGLGYIIRPECAQILLYALAGLTLACIRPSEGMSRKKAVSGAALLIVGFGAIYVPFAQLSGRALPAKLKHVLTADTADNDPRAASWGCRPLPKYQRAGLTPAPLKGVFNVMQHLSENQYYYFFPFMLLGLYRFFTRQQKRPFDAWFMALFIGVNCLMCVALYHQWGYVSRRHLLPLTAMTALFIPLGLDGVAGWICQHRLKLGERVNEKKQRRVVVVLALIGVSACLPQVFKPAGISKIGFVRAAQFLKDNTPATAIVAVPETRIAFYMERSPMLYEGAAVPPYSASWDYLVTIEDAAEVSPLPDEVAGKLISLYSHPLDESGRRRRHVVVYRRRSDTE